MMSQSNGSQPATIATPRGPRNIDRGPKAQDLLMVSNPSGPAEGCSHYEILTKHLIAEQGATGVESPQTEITNHKRLRSTVIQGLELFSISLR